MPPNALAPTTRVPNALAPVNSNSNPYISSLLQKANQDSPFIYQHNPMGIIGSGDGFAEVWPIDEEGAPNSPRPKEVPIDRFGIEVRRPNDFTHHDLAGEVLHIDPYAREISDKIAKTWTPKQLEVLKQEALDYQASLDYGQDEARAIQNATDSALRGYVVNQWPEEVNTRLGYDKSQLEMLNALKAYTKTGKK